ncbi:hypothetical protein Trydic_g11892 [Trypoxylus dichotomus]
MTERVQLVRRSPPEWFGEANVPKMVEHLPSVLEWSYIMVEVPGPLTRTIEDRNRNVVPIRNRWLSLRDGAPLAVFRVLLGGKRESHSRMSKRPWEKRFPTNDDDEIRRKNREDDEKLRASV